MKKLWLLISIGLIGGVGALQAQSTGIELNYQGGYNIPIHPRYPTIESPSHGLELAVLHRPKEERLWSVLHNRPQIAYLFGYQTLGNKAVLGRAFYLVPSLNFRIFKVGAFEGQCRIGWGVAYLTRSFHSIYNAKNIVMGARLNAYATVRFLTRYAISAHWRLFLGVSASHYSNGGFVKPNLGINIPAVQVGMQYEFGGLDTLSKSTRIRARRAAITNLPPFLKSVRPFVRVLLGGTEMATSQGVKYPIYGVTIGASKLLARTSKLRLGINYLYNTAPRAFDQHQGTRMLEHWDYARVSIVAGHELLFGRWGLLSNLGVYLNAHRLQRSLLSAELGFNFYSQNYFKQQGQQFWLGCHVRTYGGEAEFVQVVLGFQW
ncbi:MAG: acyloxyacyl hydrolase [Aureispira sp.]